MLYASLAGVAARLLLAFSGLGRDVLAWRVEVATAANSPLELREGFALYRLGVSPYSGSSCRTPPLALWLYGAAHGPASGVQDAGAELMHALPNIALDLLTATLLSRVAKQLFSPGVCERVRVYVRDAGVRGCMQDHPQRPVAAPPTPGTQLDLMTLPHVARPPSPEHGDAPSVTPLSLHASSSPRLQAGRKQAGSPGAGATGAGSAASVLPSLVAWVYLLNPFTLMSAAAGTTSPLEAAGVAAALYGAVVVAAASRGRGLALAALGLAVATHAALHCAVLLVRV